MSRKLQSQIQDIKGLPGRFKRILLAWASFANNDGANIFPAKETVAERAGVSRWTVYDNTDILEAADVLQRTGSHTCRNERCNKGGTHWTSRHGHYTAVYKINVALLGNPTLLLQKIAEATVAKSNSGTVGKIQPGTVGKPDTTQGLEETPATLGTTEDSSALASGVSKQDSEALAPLAVIANGEEKPVELTSEEEQLLRELLPVHSPDTESDPKIKSGLHRILLLAEAMDVDAIDLLRWNRSHKKGALYIRTVEQFKKALVGNEDGTYALVNEYIEHDVPACKQCHLGRNGDGRAKVKGYAQCKLLREAARVLAENKAWVDANKGKWDFALVSGAKDGNGGSAADPVMQRFVDIVNPIVDGKRGKWAPENFKVGAKLLEGGREAQMLSAAIRHVVKTGKRVTFEEFMALRNQAVWWIDSYHEVYGNGRAPDHS
jgi:hypothetical protein